MSYQSYLLRLWCETQHGRVVWRASLENIQTRERYGFAGLLELFAFLYLESFIKSPARNITPTID